MTYVAGDLSIYFNGTSEDLFEKISRIVEDETLRRSIIAKGPINARRFSWKETATRTLEPFNDK
jgi:glycosyltransferase involved in cell wall biosynthesis